MTSIYPTYIKMILFSGWISWIHCPHVLYFIFNSGNRRFCRFTEGKIHKIIKVFTIILIFFNNFLNLISLFVTFTSIWRWIDSIRMFFYLSDPILPIGMPFSLVLGAIYSNFLYHFSLISSDFHYSAIIRTKSSNFERLKFENIFFIFW